MEVSPNEGQELFFAFLNLGWTIACFVGAKNFPGWVTSGNPSKALKRLGIVLGLVAWVAGVIVLGALWPS